MAVAQIVNDPNEEATPGSEEVVGQEGAGAEQAAQPAEQAAVKPQEDEIPERYRGKSPAELIRMHEEAQKLLGRQGAELGELRRNHDEFLKAAFQGKGHPKTAQSQEEAQDDSDVEFFQNPKQAIAKAIAEHPELKALRSSQVEARAAQAKKTFQEQHPDAQAILGDPEFQQWVTGSKVRVALAMQADKNYDLDAANELLGTWKQIKGVQAARSNDDATRRRQAADAAQAEALRAGMVPTGAGAPPSGDGKKLYRRADVVRMMHQQPERYAAMENELYIAYQEGRVID